MKYVYRFGGGCFDADEGGWESPLHALGGKGLGLVKMSKMGLPVPPGFTITTEFWKDLQATGNPKELMEALMPEIMAGVDWLTGQFGYTPLLSVRSGAAVSCPGMMDTILNVGMGAHDLDQWADRLGTRTAYDCWRRLVQMLGATAFGIDMGVFDFQLARVKKEAGVKEDKELHDYQLSTLLGYYEKAFVEAVGHEFPNELGNQLHAAVKAVFDSWMNPRAVEYRRINGIPDDIGTACTIQAMVFGNMNDNSGSGVAFTRNPSTGEKKIYGEYLANAQGEDVVAGIRTPNKLVEQGGQIWVEGGPEMLKWLSDLELVVPKLEDEYRDMVDLEFTVQDGTFWLLQSRVGKRSAAAAFAIAHDLLHDEVITKEELFSRLTRKQYRIVRRPGVDPAFKVAPDEVGIPACPGVAVGRPVFTAEEAVAATDPVILVRHETDPDDIAGMHKAVGILTQTGGSTSHAAVVARSMDKPCVVGCTGLDIEALEAARSKAGSATITIDGSTGRVWIGTVVPVVDASNSPSVRAVEEMAVRQLGVSVISTMFDEEVKGHQYINAFEWMDEEDVFGGVLEEISYAEAAPRVRLDLRSPMSFYTEDDMFIEQFCPTSHTDLQLRATLACHHLAGNGANLEDMRVLLSFDVDAHPGIKEVFDKRGLVQPRAAMSLADLLAPGCEIDDSPLSPTAPLKAQLGDRWQVLLDLVTEKGFIERNTAVMSRESAVFRVLV